MNKINKNYNLSKNFINYLVIKNVSGPCNTHLNIPIQNVYYNLKNNNEWRIQKKFISSTLPKTTFSLFENFGEKTKNNYGVYSQLTFSIQPLSSQRRLFNTLNGNSNRIKVNNDTQFLVTTQTLLNKNWIIKEDVSSISTKRIVYGNLNLVRLASIKPRLNEVTENNNQVNSPMVTQENISNKENMKLTPPPPPTTTISSKIVKRTEEEIEEEEDELNKLLKTKDNFLVRPFKEIKSLIWHLIFGTQILFLEAQQAVELKNKRIENQTLTRREEILVNMLNI